jgi:general secretion pathway protein N
MRIRLPLRRAVFLVAAFAFSLVALIPLRVAVGWFGGEGRGLAAREASGSIWMGVLKEAQLGPVPLGDVHARLNILPLFLGRARLSLSRDEEGGGRFEGAVSVSRNGFGVEDMTGQIRVGALFAPLPVASLDLADVSAHFSGGLCESAEGRVRATLSGDVAGLLPGGLGGDLRCAEGALLVPLASQTGMEQLSLRFLGDGRYRADLLIRPGDPSMSARLIAAGFAASGNGFVRRLEGSF